MKKNTPECSLSPTGRHRVTADLEYDETGQTKNCEHCGEDAGEVRAQRALAKQKKKGGGPVAKKQTIDDYTTFTQVDKLLGEAAATLRRMQRLTDMQDSILHVHLVAIDDARTSLATAAESSLAFKAGESITFLGRSGKFVRYEPATLDLARAIVRWDPRPGKKTTSTSSVELRLIKRSEPVIAQQTQRRQQAREK